MAQVTVFVDEAVRGSLPPVCVKDGVRTTDRLRHDQEIGSGRAGLGVLWLLLLAGPLGWIGLFLISMSRTGHGELLTVNLPFSKRAYERLRAAERLARTSTAVAVLVGAIGVASIVLPVSFTLSDPLRIVLAITVIATFVAAMSVRIVARGRVAAADVDVRLDASRRWVTLGGVHPAFVGACAATREPVDA
jgi:hypothetical protein